MDDLNEEVEKVAEDIIKQAQSPFKREATNRIIHILTSYHELQKATTESDEPTETSTLIEDEQRILVFLSACGEAPDVDTIATSLNLSLTRTEYCLDRMRNRYVRAEHLGMGAGTCYSLLEKGRAYLVENGLVE